MDKSKQKQILETLGIKPINYGATSGSNEGWIKTSGAELTSFSPIDGQPIAKVIQADREVYEQIMARAEKGFKTFRMMPAPQTGGDRPGDRQCIAGEKRGPGGTDQS